MHPRLDAPFRALQIGLGLAAFLAGLDKFFNILAQWETYLSPLMTQLLPISAAAFMRIVGVIEMVAGAVVLAGLTRLGGYVIAAWLVAIAANLVVSGRFFDIAVRDLVMALAAFTLARLSEARSEASERTSAPSAATRRAA